MYMLSGLIANVEILARISRKKKYLPKSLSLPMTEPTSRSSRTKKLSVDPPPSSKHLKIVLYFIYVTAGMVISAGSVPADSNITGGMDPGMNKSFRLNTWKANMFVFSLGTFHCFIVIFTISASTLVLLYIKSLFIEFMIFFIFTFYLSLFSLPLLRTICPCEFVSPYFPPGVCRKDIIYLIFIQGRRQHFRINIFKDFFIYLLIVSFFYLIFKVFDIYSQTFKKYSVWIRNNSISKLFLFLIVSFFFPLSAKIDFYFGVKLIIAEFWKIQLHKFTAHTDSSFFYIFSHPLQIRNKIN